MNAGTKTLEQRAREYADRDPIELDRDGGYYCRHVAAMTQEGLHAKSDVAAELAWRDREIDRLKAALSRAAEAKGMGSGFAWQSLHTGYSLKSLTSRAADEADAEGVGTGVIKRIREIDAQGCSDAAFRLRVLRRGVGNLWRPSK